MTPIQYAIVWALVGALISATLGAVDGFSPDKGARRHAAVFLIGVLWPAIAAVSVVTLALSLLFRLPHVVMFKIVCRLRRAPQVATPPVQPRNRRVSPAPRRNGSGPLEGNGKA